MSREVLEVETSDNQDKGKEEQEQELSNVMNEQRKNKDWTEIRIRTTENRLVEKIWKLCLKHVKT